MSKIPLSAVQRGKEVRMIQIDAGKGLLRQLSHLGLEKGDVVKVMQNTQGPIIIAKENMRVVIGRGISHKIFVEEIKG